MQAIQIKPEDSLRRIVFKLRFYREAAGVSQKQASEKLSVGHRSYQRIEGGETNVDITFLLRFSQLFNINFNELVTPYAPVADDLMIYASAEEISNFENLPFVKESHFMDWVRRFQEVAPEFHDCKEFTVSPQPMCMWSPSKKCMNDALLERLDVKKEFRKMNFYFLKPDVRLNFLDNLYYHKPRFSIKKLRGVLKNGKAVDVEMYSFHTFKEDDVISLSFVNFLPVV
jgi:transcriptional regulator with XRE-family HTH domain